MTHENEPFQNRERVQLNEQQRAYSKAFLDSVYPNNLYPEDTIFDDTPTSFSDKFFSWKDEVLKNITKSRKDRKMIKNLDAVSLFEVAKTAFETIEAVEFELNSLELGEIVGEKLPEAIRELNYWNWAYMKSYLAANSWAE